MLPLTSRDTRKPNQTDWSSPSNFRQGAMNGTEWSLYIILRNFTCRGAGTCLLRIMATYLAPTQQGDVQDAAPTTPTPTYVASSGMVTWEMPPWEGWLWGKGALASGLGFDFEDFFFEERQHLKSDANWPTSFTKYGFGTWNNLTTLIRNLGTGASWHRTCRQVER